MKELKPTRDQVFARLLNQGEREQGGIIIPETVREPLREAEVLAVGEGRRNDDGDRIPMTVKVGDRIFMRTYTTIDLDGEDLVVVEEGQVLAIVDEEVMM